MRARVRRHGTANQDPLPTSPILDMHIVLVKLNNRAGIEVKIRVRTYLIYPPGTGLAAFEDDR